MSASAEQREHAVDRVVRLFRALKQCAAAGEPCPTNAQLAERLGCGRTAVINGINLLEVAGMIDVRRGQSRRVVTICATGASTAGTVKRLHHTRRAA